ncbi:uncharacterized protein [Dysidea avara]|uniref:uncharacterized protein n=1 Tax=Dysidea avara TaxID=196820 RepID=UPI003323D1E9
MKLLTINIRCDEPGIQERLDELGKVVKSKRPEFIAIQDITVDVGRKVQAAPWAQRYHFLMPPARYDTRNKPSVALLSAYPSQESKSLQYEGAKPTEVLLRSYYVMFDKSRQPHVVTIVTTHMENEPEDTMIREKQLNEAMGMLDDHEDVWLLGDFNIMRDIDGPLSLGGEWKDGWLESGSSCEDGDTFVPSKNPLIKNKGLPSARPDRIFYKSRRYCFESMELVGSDPVISSHFGVLLTLYQQEGNLADAMATPGVICAFNRPT